mmetsp:Transcript_108989/g.307171  ORF Transcript_108989/g.307171 Transcript_108989/m.307171 type:complete len:580 (+) Transcript_108989:145-1884(+)
MSTDYQNSILWRGEDPIKAKFKPKYDGTKKVHRYFPGQLPRWSKDGEQDEDDEPDAPPERASGFSRGSRSSPPRRRTSPPVSSSRRERREREREREREQRKPTAVVEDAAIGRLRRLQAQSQAGEVGHAERVAARIARHRAQQQAQIIEEAPKADGSEGDAEEAPKVEPLGAEAPKEEALEEEAPKEDAPKEDASKDDAPKSEDEDVEKDPGHSIEEDLKALRELLKVEAKDEDLDMESKAPVAELRFDDVKDKVKEEQDEEDARAAQRERARQLALQRRREEEAALIKEEAEADELAEEDDDEEESEEESESDSDDPRRGAMMKPVFVSRSQRETIKEREMLQKEEELAEVRKEEKKKERKAETKTMVVDEIRRDDEAEREGLNENDASDIELIDDDDEKNEAEEYEKWKIRELRRIKRDKEERLERQKELEYIERRRRMTDEEREADDRKLDASANVKDEAKQFNFLQKYYHRGGFFQDKARTGEEPLYLRDYHEPLAEERYDKQLLPKAMQLRRGQFGKKGQVKHTHLTEADTSDMSAAWSQHSKQVQKYQERMATASGIMNFDRPSRRSSGSGGI